MAFIYPRKKVRMRESHYQSRLRKKLEDRFPGCMVLKNDSSLVQGIVDYLILYKDRWASLEVKVSEDAKVQPNQDYFVRKLNDMSFCSYIYPENEAEVLDALQKAFESPRGTRVSQP